MPALALQHRPSFENVFPKDHPLAKRGSGEQHIPLSPESPRLQVEALRRIVSFHSHFRRRMHMITHHTPGGGTIIHLDLHAILDTHQTIVIPPVIEERTRDMAMGSRNRMMHMLYTRTSHGNNWQTINRLENADEEEKKNHKIIAKKDHDDQPALEKAKPSFKVLYVRPNTKETPAMLQLPAHSPSEKPAALSA